MYCLVYMRPSAATVQLFRCLICAAHCTSGPPTPFQRGRAPLPGCLAACLHALAAAVLPLLCTRGAGVWVVVLAAVAPRHLAPVALPLPGAQGPPATGAGGAPPGVAVAGSAVLGRALQAGQGDGQAGAGRLSVHWQCLLSRQGVPAALPRPVRCCSCTPLPARLPVSTAPSHTCRPLRQSRSCKGSTALRSAPSR